MYLKFFLLYSLVSGKIIKNINCPACRNCKYYKPYENGKFDSTLSKCEFFGTKNIHSDVIEYDYADLCRSDQDKCGLEGKHFVKEEDIGSKMLLHTIYRSAPIAFCFLLLILQVYNGIKIDKM